MFELGVGISMNIGIIVGMNIGKVIGKDKPPPRLMPHSTSYSGNSN